MIQIYNAITSWTGFVPQHDTNSVKMGHAEQQVTKFHQINFC